MNDSFVDNYYFQETHLLIRIDCDIIDITFKVKGMDIIMLDNTKDALPLYLQIKMIIKKRLDDKVYEVGDILPSELEFQDEFKVSRITVRNAINELVHEGYLQRTRGKGTIVLFRKLNEKISSARSFTQEMADLGLCAVTRDVKISIIKADSFIAEHLGINTGDYALHIERIRGVEEYPIGYFDSYFSIERNLPIDKDLYYGSLYETIKNHIGIDWMVDISRFTDKFESIEADSILAERLDVKNGAPILKRTSQTVDKDGVILEFTICYYRADKYSCTITYQ